MRVRKIDTQNRQDVRKFINVALDLYKGNPFFCPTLETEARSSLDRTKNTVHSGRL